MKKIHLLLLALFFILGANAQMVLEYEITEPQTSIKIPLSGTVDVTVDWGDGSKEDFKTVGHKVHIYTSSGTKTVTITGTLTHYGTGFPSEWNKYLIKVLSWNNLGLESLSYAFRQAVNLTSVPDSLPVTVKDLNSMFYKASSFNQSIGSWHTDSIIDMGSMFQDAESFNQPIGNWNTQNVIGMYSMFASAKSFNQPIGGWNTENVTDMDAMFYEASVFNQPLENWDISYVERMGNMFSLSSLCTENYDATLNGWSSQTVQSGVTFDGGNSKYSVASEAARTTLAEKWTITDGGLGTTEHDKCASLVGTEGYLASGNVDFYPNPVLDKLYINTTSLSSYAVYSLTGNLLEEVVGSKTQIDLSELPSGVYILQTTSELGIKNQRFSKE